MTNYIPPLTITPHMLNRVVQISELLGRWSAMADTTLTPTLRRGNRIRTIQASLAIEQNTLSVAQVTAVLEGKAVRGSVREIAEVRNAFAAYEAMPLWVAHSEADVLTAHRALMSGLVDECGVYRSGGVGIYQNQQLVHLAPPASRVPELMRDLLHWLASTDLPPLISSCVFHYEFEFIHPFADGNGRMGRLWQTLILSQWRSELAWLPIETLIHERQAAYYAALGQADRAGESTLFVAFMLDVIHANLQAHLLKHDGVNDGVNEGVNALDDLDRQILRMMRELPRINQSQLAQDLNCSVPTIQRRIRALRGTYIERVGSDKKGHWRVLDRYIDHD